MSDTIKQETHYRLFEINGEIYFLVIYESAHQTLAKRLFIGPSSNLTEEHITKITNQPNGEETIFSPLGILYIPSQYLNLANTPPSWNKKPMVEIPIGNFIAEAVVTEAGHKYAVIFR